MLRITGYHSGTTASFPGAQASRLRLNELATGINLYELTGAGGQLTLKACLVDAWPMREQMTNDPTSLPGLELSDSEFEQSGWKPDDGWIGLVPSLSTLADVIARLGQPSASSSLANAECYDFKDGAVRATFLHGETTLFKVWVSWKFDDPSLMPRDLKEASSMFGRLKATRIEKTVGIIYERPGLRLACEDATEPKVIKWIEFYRPR